MAHLKYSSYPGFGEHNFENWHYSSAVRIPPGEQIQISGQGGWDRATGKVKSSLAEEFSQVHITSTDFYLVQSSNITTRPSTM